MFDLIENGESALSVRNKINELIAAANDGNVSNLLPSRARFVAEQDRFADAVDGDIVFAGPHCYKRLASSGAISDLPGWVPEIYVAPQHFGGMASTHVTAAWAYYQSVMGTGAAASQAASGGLFFHFPSGVYNPDGSLVTLTTAGFGQIIRGDGWSSRLNNVAIVIADGGVTVRDLDMSGFAKATDAITWTPRAANIRRGTVSDVRIRDARYGLRTIDDVNVAWVHCVRVYVEQCVTGARFDRVIGNSFYQCQFRANDEQGFVLYRGGELRIDNCRFNGNGAAGLRLDGAFRSQVVVENYIQNSSFSGNYSSDANRATWAITGAADNGSGGTRLTLDVSGGRHMLSTGLIRIDVTGTTDYNGTHVLNNVTDTTVDIAVPYTSSQTGTIWDYGFDVEIVGDAAIRPGQVNDQWFLGNNINNFYAHDCVNIYFTGTRLKQRAFLDGGCNGITRVSTSRGRLNSTEEDDDEDEGIDTGSWSPVEFTGQNDGFTETVPIFGSGWTDFRGMITRTPDPNVALIGNKVQAYNSAHVDKDGVKLTGVSQLTGSILAASAVDTTAGRLWRNQTGGMFGWGAPVAGNAAITDLNALTLPSGIYGTTSAATVSGTWPPGETASTGLLLVMNRAANSTMQIFARTSGQDRTWFRLAQSGVWTTWKSLYGGHLTSVAATPAYVGQEALVNGIWYEAIAASAATDWKPRSGYLTSIAATPPAVGAMALSGGHFYMAVGTSSSADWKQITA